MNRTQLIVINKPKSTLSMTKGAIGIVLSRYVSVYMPLLIAVPAAVGDGDAENG